MNPKPAGSVCSAPDFDVAFDRALATSSDSILPSSGFASSVLTAIYREVSAPAPIPFPWRRAIPGFGAALIAAALLISAVLSFLQSASSRGLPAPSQNWQALSAPLVHHATDVLGLSIAFAVSLACLVFCRRIVSNH
jgi:hypothetical protein